MEYSGQWEGEEKQNGRRERRGGASNGREEGREG